MKKPEFYLQHIIEAADELHSYVQNVSQDAFVQDSMRYNATIRLIQVIGEAIRNLEEDFMDKHQTIPWKQIIAMRNILIHEYWQTDLQEVYYSATVEVPKLRDLISSILQDLKSQETESHQ